MTEMQERIQRVLDAEMSEGQKLSLIKRIVRRTIPNDALDAKRYRHIRAKAQMRGEIDFDKAVDDSIEKDQE